MTDHVVILCCALLTCLALGFEKRREGNVLFRQYSVILSRSIHKKGWNERLDWGALQVEQGWVVVRKKKRGCTGWLIRTCSLRHSVLHSTQARASVSSGWNICLWRTRHGLCALWWVYCCACERWRSDWACNVSRERCKIKSRAMSGRRGVNVVNFRMMLQWATRLIAVEMKVTSHSSILEQDSCHRT